MKEQTDPVVGILRPDLELIRSTPPLLFDRNSDSYFKIAPEMADIAAFMTKSMPLAQFMELLRRNGMVIPEENVINLLVFLKQNNLLVPEYGEIERKRSAVKTNKEKNRFLRFSAAYLFFRLPPWRPEKFFEKIKPFVSWIGSKTTVMFLLIPAIFGYLMMFREFGAVKAAFINTISWANLVKYFAAIVLLKLLHEASHSIAAIHFNCRVRGIGIGLMVFYPRFYTDTTDCWRLPKSQRLLIDGAGIIAEVLFGGIAALLWCYLPPGMWKSTMFYIFAVSTLSTLLVNGNPFIRYDGYYILCDLTDMDNLMSRSSEYIKQFWRYYLLRLGKKPEHEKGMFLLVFGIFSFIYRIFLYTSIILVIYHKFIKVLAVVMMILELYSIMIYPFWKEIQTIKLLSEQSANQARKYFIIILLLLTGGILFIPFPWNIKLPGECVPMEKTMVAIPESGYLSEKFSHKSRMVKKGDLILKLTSTDLDIAIEKLEKSLKYDKMLYQQQSTDQKNYFLSSITIEKIRSGSLRMKELLRRKNNLRIVAVNGGVFVPRIPELSAGAYLFKGQLAGEIISEKLKIHGYATDQQISYIKIGDTAIVQLGKSLSSCRAKIINIAQVAVDLKNSPLLQPFGGPIPGCVKENSPMDYESVHPLYRIELELDSEKHNLSVGRSVTVKTDHSHQLYKPVIRFFISIFRREF